MLFTRAELEAVELSTLASYASHSRSSRGRVYAEDESAHRTAYQRDRDRILHSAAFRRLEYKTQVFVNDEGDYYRTRLTHTLEVAQIGRSIARALRVNEDLVEAICLAHDLGHPPFGHAGERVLDALMTEQGGFNHNFQSYRVVTELEERYPRWRGLNLTREALHGLAKHETDFDLSQAAGVDPGLRGSVEAQIANLTDELAYAAHDLDDGLLAGLITVEDLHSLDIWRLLCDTLQWRGGRFDDVVRHQFIRELVGVLTTDVLHMSAQTLERVNPVSVDAVQAARENVICYSEHMNEMRVALRTFLYEHMYYHPRVVRMARRAERFIGAIFESLSQDPRQLPKEHQALVGERGLHRVTADYIASMTDRSAILEYRRLYDPGMRP